MKTPNKSVPGRGSALVITLCFLVLISTVVIAFFIQSLLNRQISLSSAGQERARLVALSALDDIQGALRAEMQAGAISYAPPSPSPATSPTTYIMRPKSAKAMAPYHMPPPPGTATPDPTTYYNLVKYSGYGSPTPALFWPANVTYAAPASGTPNANTPMPASIVPTSATSANGRSVSLTRWAKPALTAAVSHSPSYPAALVPYWVLTSRQGVVTNPATAGATLADSTSTNPNYVVGRFGYVVYDEGGLIDIAAGGYPSSVAATATANKGSQGFADLTQLGLTSTQSDALVNWRNLASAAAPAATNYPNYLSTFAPLYGFMRAAPGDSAFVSRQDFLNFWQKNVTTQTDLLPYFTTFSREKNAPSWGPYSDAYTLFGATTLPTQTGTPTAGGTPYPPMGTPVPPGAPSSTPGSDGFINAASGLGTPYPAEYAYAYNDIAHLAGTATTTGSAPALTPDFNRLFPGVRVTTILPTGPTRLNGDKFVLGEPLVKNRFDLSKLSWIYHNSFAAFSKLPTGVQMSDVYNYFGLVPGSDGWSWTYNHVNNTLPQSTVSTPHIMTLDEVAAAGREPDFFELLQAGILQGSLGAGVGSDAKGAFGLDSGHGGYGGIFYRAENPNPPTAPAMLREDLTPGNVVVAQESYQIIQIGANIIDQANTSGLPREIVLNGEHFYGIENLPYMDGLTDTAFRPTPDTTAATITLATQGAVLKSDYQAYVHRWICAALWNPHQNSSQSKNGVAKVRIFGHSGSMIPSVFGLSGQTYYGPGDGAPDWGTSHPWLSVNLADYTSGFNGCNGPFSEPTFIDYNLSSTSDNGGVAEPAQNADQGNYGKVKSQFTGKTAWTRAGLYVGYSYSPESGNRISKCATLWAPTTATPSPSPDTNSSGNSPYSATMSYPASPTIYLQYLDPTPGGSWHTYQEVRSLYHIYDLAGDPWMEPNDIEWKSTWWTQNIKPGVNTLGPIAASDDAYSVEALDPRSQRMNMRHRAFNTAWSAFLESDSTHRMDAPQIASSHYSFSTAQGGVSQYWADYASNVMADPVTGSTAANALFTVYTDNDFVLRPADAGGWGLAEDPQQPAGSTSAGTATAARPIILNRPFLSVGELGFVSSDRAWKTLDFSSAQSPDAALLDIFCIGAATASNQPPPNIVAGKINLNSISLNSTKTTAPVLQALLANAARTYTGNPAAANTSTTLTSTTDMQTIAAAVANFAKTTPLRSLADLPLAFPTPSPSPNVPAPVSTPFPGNKVQREAMVRALADSCGTRTWNLLIDVIAQSGHLKNGSTGPAVTGTSPAVDNFIVEGEKRYWLHVAIDRFTGEIVDKQLEPVFEQ